MSPRGFHFESKNGNCYYYDDLTGVVTARVTDGPNELPWQAGTPQTPANTWPQRMDSAGDYATEIERYLETEGYRQLILVVTEECNLRCRYCVYSGNYENERRHQPKNMPFEVAQQAVDGYLRKWPNIKARDPQKRPLISFYGGEPLLHTNVIMSAVSHAKRVYSGDIGFNLTTNGTVMPPDALDFMVANDFLLTITLNGSQVEHDRLRVYPSGEGSFPSVWRTLQMVRDRYPDYYIKKCNIMTDYDWGTDLKGVATFFGAHGDVLRLGRVGMISPRFTHWYRQYTFDQRRVFHASVEALKKLYFAQLSERRSPTGFLECLFADDYRNIVERPYGKVSRPAYLPYTGTCIPGEKIAVDPEGNLHCCEKVNYHFPIGNVETGLDIQRITDLVDNYRKGLYPQCFDCPVTRVCSVCYAVTAGVGKFERNPPDLCYELQNAVKEMFVDLWTLFEAGVKEDAFLLPVTTE